MKICENGVYRDMTPEEYAEYTVNGELSPQEEIVRLKRNLSETDYKAIKFAEGLITSADYEPERVLRNSWRERINIIERSVKA